MPISERVRDNGTELGLSGGLTIFEAAELRAQLVAALDSTAGGLTLDLSEVEEIDTAGIQLLLALKRHAANTGKTLGYSLHSPAVLAVIDLLNLASVLGDPVLVPSGR